MSMAAGAVPKQTNEQLVILIQAGEDVANNMLKLWQQTKNFIYTLARKYFGYAEEEDLMQEGYLGLCEAVRRYDPEQGVPFINYSAFWINQVLKRYIDNCGSTVRIPVHLRGDIGKYNNFVKEYRKYYNYEPTERVIREYLGFDREKLECVKKAENMAKIFSLSEPIGGEDEEILLVDSVSSDYNLEEECVKRLDQEQLQHDVRKAIGGLSEELQKVIQYRYFDRLTLKETGERLGVSIERARQMEAKAMRKMRIPSRSEKLRNYHEQYLTAAPVYHIGVERFNITWTSSVEAELGLW